MKGNIVAQAIARMPSPAQQQAYEVTLLTAAGHGPTEIGNRLGLTWPKVEEVRELIGVEVLGVLRDGGYSPGEIAATLGIPTPMNTCQPTGTPANSASRGSRPSALGAATPSPVSGL